MARIDYYALEEAIQTVLTGDATLAGVTVVIEEDLLTSAEQTPWVGIYLADREDAGAPLAAGQQQRFRIRFEIWCYEHRMEIPQAAKARDDLMGKVEIALLKKPTLDSNVVRMVITGGAFETGRGDAGFFMGGSIVLEVEKKATTT